MVLEDMAIDHTQILLLMYTSQTEPSTISILSLDFIVRRSFELFLTYSSHFLRSIVFVFDPKMAIQLRRIPNISEMVSDEINKVLATRDLYVYQST